MRSDRADVREEPYHKIGIMPEDPFITIDRQGVGELVRIHPNVADLYVSKVNGLRNALNEDGAREEAAQILRSLVDEIRLHPIDGQLQIELIGDLATLLGFAEKKGADNKKPGSLGDPGSTKWLGAGVCNNQAPTNSELRKTI